MSDEPTLTHDAQAHRYEAHLAGARVGTAEYVRDGDVLTFTHTVVDPAQRGKGVAGRLIAFAMRDVADRGERIVPQCSYVRSWVQEHPDAAPPLA